MPPRIATWLLKHFGSGPDNQTLLGDLAEQYHRNNSALWYWRQSMAAIPVSLWKEVRGNKGIAASALLTGWTLFVLCGYLMPLLIGRPVPGPFGLIFSPLFGGGISILPFEPRYELEYVYVFIYSLVFPLIVGTVCGWVVACFNNGQRTGMVLLFATPMLLLDLLLFGPLLYTRISTPTYTWNTALLGNIVSSTLGILLGGGQLHREPATESATINKCH